MSRAGGVPDAWDDDWVNAADVRINDKHLSAMIAC